MSYWTALAVVQQVAGELGLPQPTTLVGTTDVQSLQLLSMLQSAGNELLLYYPWEQFVVTQTLTLVPAQDEYAIPADLAYYRDQTQWDAVNHWPLLGPKSAQEWAWLKNSFVASLPRLRYRIKNNKFCVYPPPPGAGTLYMEYISNYWVSIASAPDTRAASLITNDSDLLWYDPWLLIKFLKLKFYELKGFETKNVQAEFMRIFENLTGKDTGAEKLSLAPRYQTPYIGPWSIPDGSWNV